MNGLLARDGRRGEGNLADQHNIRVATTNGFTLSEFPDQAFDIVFAQGVLGYLAPNPLLALLDEVHRVMRPGGRCIINFFTIDHPEDARRQLEGVRTSALKRGFAASMEQAYTIAHLRTMYAAAGLVVDEPGPGIDDTPPQRGRVIVVAHA